MTDIEKNLKRLNEILKVLNAENFFNLSVTEYRVNLQGFYDKEKERMINDNGFTLIDDQSRHLWFEKKFEDNSGTYNVFLSK